MIRILGILLVVSMCSFSYAGGFYKWRDETGKVHITDYLPDGVEVISGDSGSAVNKVSGPAIQSGPSQGAGYASGDDAAHDAGSSRELDAEIAAAKDKYDSCMRNVKGEIGNDLTKNFDIIVKRKECQRYMDIYENLLYSKYGARKIAGSGGADSSSSKHTIASPQDAETPRQNTLPPPQHMVVNPHGGATDQYGTYYAPAGAGNMVNTKTGSQVINQGGNTYLDTQTGRIMHGN